MAFHLPKTSVRTETMWYLLAAVFFAIGTVGALGAWVFHWWKDPWQWASPLSLALSAVSLGWGASARDLRRMRDRLIAGQDRIIAGQERLIAGQAEQTGLLREVVAPFRRA